MTRAENRARWQALLRQQSESAVSVTAFCREHGVRTKDLYRWRRRFRGAAGTEQSGALRPFVELKPSRCLAGPGSGVRIHIDGRMNVQVDRDFDAATLRAVLAAIAEGADR